MKEKPLSRKEAVAKTLEDVGMALKIVLDFLETDEVNLKDIEVQRKVPEFPWDARDQTITEIMVSLEGLRNRIKRIEGW
jgi:hypothetical protein